MDLYAQDSLSFPNVIEGTTPCEVKCAAKQGAHMLQNQAWIQRGCQTRERSGMQPTWVTKQHNPHITRIIIWAGFQWNFFLCVIVSQTLVILSAVFVLFSCCCSSFFLSSPSLLSSTPRLFFAHSINSGYLYPVISWPKKSYLRAWIILNNKTSILIDSTISNII